MKTKLFILLIFLSSIHLSKAEVTLPNIFSDNMVLQRNAEVAFWGWGNLNEEVTITTGWDQKQYTVKTALDTKWKVLVATPEAGGPFTITIKGDNEIVLQNILVGEVWLCSGQSNMEWSATTSAGIDNAEEEIKNANYPNIRLLTIPKRTSEFPQESVPGSWEVCTPDTMKDFSAVAYLFARRLQGELNVPIGLIDNAWGGTPAEVWTPVSVFENHKDLKEAAKAVENNKWSPGFTAALYNAMVYPIVPFRIAGTIWYQGESNTANYSTYAKLFSEMVASWRSAWGYEFPFYYVQIAPYKYGTEEVGVLIRDQQRRALKMIPNSGMVVTSDIATIDDIHPPNKQDVGLRMANIALKEHYKEIEGVVHSPLFNTMSIQGKKVEVTFDNAEGLFSKGKKITHFEIAGDDGQFYPAKAIIKNDRIILSSKEVKVPNKVRYAWNNIAEPNLFNGAGLPVSSFTSEKQ
ncbi:sialate O-acetylesterase [Ulvibacterium marinum]|uniref:sialate O-acetylesterase n=1 Tax=Ulvibacterium marinum TaxID=2419782 RepID=UPI0024946A49|nr:sialate O-acetylesterase [Ulvibacterium marinum]